MAKRLDGGQGHTTLGIVNVAGKKLTKLRFVSMVATKERNGTEGVGVAAGGELGLVVLQRGSNLGDIPRLVLFSQCGDGCVGDLIAEGRLAKRLVYQSVRLPVLVAGQAVDDLYPDRRIFFAVENALEEGQGTGLGLAGNVGDDLRAHLGVGLIG